MDAVLASRIPRRQLIIQSFIAPSLDVARQRLPGVRTSLLSVQAINEAFLQAAADSNYDFISPEWPVTADYIRRAHGMGLDVAPFTLDAAADVRAASSARADAVITDDASWPPARSGCVRARFFSAGAFIDGRRLIATGDLLTPRGVSARQGCRGTVTMRVTIGSRPTRSVQGRLNRNCEFRFGTRRTPPRLGAPAGHDPLQRQRARAAAARGPEARRAQAAGVHALTSARDQERLGAGAGDRVGEVASAHEARHVAGPGVAAGHVQPRAPGHLTHVGQRVLAVADHSRPAVAHGGGRRRAPRAGSARPAPRSRGCPRRCPCRSRRRPSH